jgi:hypothetical protein
VDRGGDRDRALAEGGGDDAGGDDDAVVCAVADDGDGGDAADAQVRQGRLDVGVVVEQVAARCREVDADGGGEPPVAEADGDEFVIRVVAGRGGGDDDEFGACRRVDRCGHDVPFEGSARAVTARG